MSDASASPPPDASHRRSLSRSEAQRREEQRRINREHRRAQRPRLGWDWRTRDAGASRSGRVRRRRRRVTVTEVLGVAAVAAVSAWLLHLQGVTPTDDPGLNLAIGSSVTVVVAIAGAAIDRHVLVAWGVVALVASTGRRFVRGVTFDTLAGSGWQLLAGLVAVGLASGVAVIDRRGRTIFAPVLGAASASLSLQCLASVPERNWPTVGALLAGATLLGVLYAVAVRVRPAWLFD